MHLKFTEDILPVTDFRNNAADILNQLATTGRPICLTQRGRASAVLIDVQQYQRLCDRLEALERQLGEGGAPGGATMSEPVSLVQELERWIEKSG